MKYLKTYKLFESDILTHRGVTDQENIKSEIDNILLDIKDLGYKVTIMSDSEKHRAFILFGKSHIEETIEIRISKLPYFKFKKTDIPFVECLQHLFSYLIDLGYVGTLEIFCLNLGTNLPITLTTGGEIKDINVLERILNVNNISIYTIEIKFTRVV